MYRTFANGFGFELLSLLFQVIIVKSIGTPLIWSSLGVWQ